MATYYSKSTQMEVDQKPERAKLKLTVKSATALIRQDTPAKQSQYAVWRNRTVAAVTIKCIATSLLLIRKQDGSMCLKRSLFFVLIERKLKLMGSN